MDILQILKNKQKRCEFFKWFDNDPYIAMTMSLITGFLFSGISWGIVYVIIFLIIYEFFYFAYLHANYKEWKNSERIGVVFAALLGYLLGSIFHNNWDYYNHWNNFKNDCDQYGKNLDWW